MEFELGLKLTRVADEFGSSFQIAKDREGPVFLSRETDAMFILSAHLKGYLRRNIKIDINEDGTLIAISGERQVKETVMVGWKVYKEDAEVKRFKKVFRIPDGVILDEIMAKFDNESTLTITMPKKVKGICGTAIEEIQDKPELVREGSGSLQIVDDKVQRAETSDKENGDEMLSETQKPEEVKQAQKMESEIQEMTQTQEDKEHDQQQTTDQDLTETNDVQAGEKQNEETAEDGAGKRQDQENGLQDKRFKMCIPIIAGSTILLSFVVFVFQIIRSKNRTPRRTD